MEKMTFDEYVNKQMELRRIQGENKMKHKTKRGIGVVPCFSVSEKNCRVLRTAYMAAAAANEAGQQH